MNMKKTIGICATLLAALLCVVPQSAQATGKIRSVEAYDPDGLHSFPNAGSALTVGDKIRVRFRMVNVQWANTVADSSYANPWEFMYTGSLTGNVDIDELLRQLANKPRLGLWISGKVCEAECVNWPMGAASDWLTDRLDGEQHYTDLIFEYTVQAGDLALPVQLANAQGTGPAVGEETYYLKCNGLDTLWKMVDQRTHSVTNDFAFGPSNLYDDPDFAGEDLTKWRRVNTPDVENRDLDLSGAGVYVQAIDFDTTYFKESEGVWRSIAQGSTTSDPGTPTIAIAGGAARPMDLYLWTESNTVAEVVTGGQVTEVSEYVFGDGVTRKVGKVHINQGNESVPFSIKATGAAGASTKVFLSASPTNIYNAANDLVTNFITRTVQVGEPLPPGINVTVNGKTKETVTAIADYATALVGVNVTLSEAWNGSDYLTIPLKVSVKEKPDLNARDYVGMSQSSMDDNTAWDTELTILPGQTSASQSLWLYANRGTIDTESNGLLVEVDTNAMSTAARAFFTGKILPATVVVNRSTPEITADLAPITAEANTPQDVTINVADAYGDMRDPCRYTVYWSNSGNDSAAYYTRITNLTASAAGDITFSVTYTTKGDYVSRFYVVNADGKQSTKHTVAVTVTAQKVIEAVPVDPSRKYAEMASDDDRAIATLDFGEGGFVMPNDALEGYIFLVPRDENSSNLVESAEFGDDWKRGLRVFTGDPSAGPIVMTLLDGGNGNSGIQMNYDIVVRTAANWDEGTIVSTWNSRGLTFSVTNVAPNVTAVTMGTETLEENGGTIGTVPLGVTKAFFAETDEPSDLDFYAGSPDYTDTAKSFETHWDIKLGSSTLFSTNIFGPPSVPFNYVFRQAGTYDIEVSMRDKDSVDRTRYPRRYGPKFTFKVNVDAKPHITLMPYNGGDVFYLHEQLGSDESRLNQGREYARINVGLSMVPSEEITVHFDVTRVGTDDGNYPLPRLNTYDLKFGGASGMDNKFVYFEWLDGTPQGYNPGFIVTATVTNTTLNADGVAWKDLYTPFTLPVMVENDNPIIKEPSTNETTVAKGQNVRVTYTVKEVTGDLAAGLTLTWTTSEGVTTNYQITATSVGQYASYSGQSPYFSFSSPGSQTLSLLVEDKDGGYKQVEWHYFVSPAKSLNIYPCGPHNTGSGTDLCNFYLGADGRGQGRVWVEDGAIMDVKRFVHTYSYSPSKADDTIFARGYRVGEVDDGSLMPDADKDIRIDLGGNYNKGAPIADYYKYTNARLDSFFYCWLVCMPGEGGGGSGTGGTRMGSLMSFKPEVGTDDGRQLVTLDDKEVGEEEAIRDYDIIELDAIFSREYLQSDNVGDINRDGIPDYFAVKKPYNNGSRVMMLYTAANGGDSGGDASGDGSDLVSLAKFNGDGDYLPADSMTTGNILPTADTWNIQGEAFRAEWEIRGFDEHLNFRRENSSEDGSKNYNVSGEWISVPTFSEAETNAVALKNGVQTWAAFKANAPTNETEYAEAYAAWTNQFMAAVLRPDSWIPENRTNPILDDTDEDGFPDGVEYYFWYYSQVGWIDGKGKWQRLEGEKFQLDDIAKGIPITSDEIAEAFDPTMAAKMTGTDKIENRDTDNDGLTDLEEIAAGTNPVHWDTDGDGMSDLWEIMRGLDPLKKDDASANADGDFMAIVDLKDNYAVLTYTTNDVTESWAIPNNGAGCVDTETGKLSAAATGTVYGVKVYRYGNASSPWTPVNRGSHQNTDDEDAKPLKTDVLDLAAVAAVVEADNTDLINAVTVLAKQHIRLVHGQVFAQYGFDPRTAWYKNDGGYVADRWKTANSTAKYAGETGKAMNTDKFTAIHEYLLLKYRYNTSPVHSKVNPSDESDKTYSLARDKANIASKKMTMADVLNLGTTNPNVPYEEKTYGDLGVATTSSGSEESGTAESSTPATTHSNKNHGADTDADGVPDGWELYVGHNPNTSGGGDLDTKDSDALGLVAEYAGTDSCNAYQTAVDGDGKATIYTNHTGNVKGWFNKFFPTNPWNGDTDGDGIDDDDEGNTWHASFRYGNLGSQDAHTHTYTFIYGPNEGKPEDDGTICIRGGGLNPCSVDTDGDCLPDPWEREFAGVVFNEQGMPDAISLSDGIITLIRRSDGLKTGQAVQRPYITAGMDGTHGFRMENAVQTGDSYTNPHYTDPFTGTIRNFDFDHDGLQNFQEYLVQALRHLRYDDGETPLMGQWIPKDSPRQFFAFLPMNIMDGETYYKKVKAAGIPTTGAFKFEDLGYFARPAHKWDLTAQNTYSEMMVNYDSCGYRIMLRPKGALGYCSTDPRTFDTDQDGLDDYYEIFHGLNPLLGSIGDPANGSIVNDVIAWAYGGAVAWCANTWTAGEQFGEGNSPYDAMKYPWMMGTPEADADGDGKPNSEEGIYVNLSTPRPTHTDPTPLWMTDSTSRGKASYTAQYYQMDPDAEVPDFMTGAYPWSWNSSNGSVHEKGQFWMFSFEENEGYDTDHDGLNDLTEGTTTATVASDPLVFSDPDRRQALWFPGANSAAVSYNSTFRREVELEYSLLKRFTVEAWICPEVVTRDQVILERTVNCSPNTLSNNVTKIRANFRIGLMADGRLYGQFDTMDAIATGSGDSSPTVVSTFAQTANKWSHVALSYDGVVLTLYVDGQVAGTFQTSLAPANGILVLAQDAVPGNTYFPVLGRGYDVLPAAVVLGARAIGANGVELSEKTTWSDFDSFYQGYLDEVRVWDDVRTSAQILTSMKQRLTFDDVKALRDEIFESWYDAATRNDNDGYPNLPAELVLHYNFQTLYGAVNEADVTREPVGFKKNVIDNVRVDGGYVPGGLECGWWAALQDTVGSTVYDNYHVVPWIPNTCAHLPFMDGSSPDSQYWSTYFGGVAYASELLPALGMDSTATEPTLQFANAANPYPYYNYCGDRQNRWNAFSMLSELNRTFAEKYWLWRFEMRTGLVGCSDLVPLGGAFAKRTAEMWDGDGAASAWELTGWDDDADGIPDWWEAVAVSRYGAGANFKWDSEVNYNGTTMTAREAYLRDLASGMLPNGNVYEDYRTKADTNHNGLPDWWENLYGITSAMEDADRDGLSNYAEYLIGEGFTNVGFPKVNPSLAHTFGQFVPDYFLRVGSLYLGEMFGDHDMMEDVWEDQYDVEKISRGVWDAVRDSDGDGWSNFAECRANTDPTRENVRGIDDYTIPQYPTPTVSATIVYNGQDTLGHPLIVQAFSRRRGLDGSPDAVWEVGSASQDKAAKMKYIGLNPNASWKATLGPGAVKPGTLKVSFKDPKWYSGTVTNRVYGTLENAEWMTWLSDGIQAGSSVQGDIVTQNIARNDEPVGTINYETGEASIDFTRLQGIVEILVSEKGGGGSSDNNKYIHLSTSYVKIEWESKVPPGNSRVTLSLGEECDGRLREGENTFVAFLDSKTADGKWTPGEPYGVVTGVDVGWSGTSCEIELTDTTPQIVRINLASIQANNFDSVNALTDRGKSVTPKGYAANTPNAHPGTNATASASGLTKVRVVRNEINGSNGGSSSYSAVVFERDFDLSVHPALTEADLLGVGLYDLDWGTLLPAWEATGGTPAALESVTYRIVIGDGEVGQYEQFCDGNLALNFGNRFEAGLIQTPTVPDPTLPQIVYAGRPTFRWSHANTIDKAYPAFQLRIYAADQTTLVYDSGVQPAPIRNADGMYEWTAPVYAGMLTAQGQVFSSPNTYYWSVSMLDAKFTAFNPYEAKTMFRLEDTGNVNDGRCYGSIKAAVKYFGPLVGSISSGASLKNLIHVQAFTSPDFTGKPVGEAYVTDVSQIASTTEVVANAIIRGVPPGTYYVRAFIDTDSNFKKDAWETWGYGCYVGAIDAPYANVTRSGSTASAADFPYTPRPYTVMTEEEVPEATIYLEDADTDFDGFPDAWEMQTYGSLATRAPITGNTFFATVNPNLLTSLSSYNLGSDVSGSTANLGFTLMGALLNSSGGSAVMAASLLSASPESAVEETAVRIKSFSLDDGLELEVVNKVSPDASDLIIFKNEANVTLSLVCASSADFSDAVEVPIKTVTIYANKKTDDVVVTAEELATARARVPDARFFKAVIK